MARTKNRAIRSRCTCARRARAGMCRARASNGFVERTFDSFAASFEAKLEQLSYRAPALAAAMLEESGLEASKQLDVLDAGCGTGLCGPLLAPYARRLIGVDLSEGMLALAKEKHVYDVLIKGELTDHMRAQPARVRCDCVGRHAGVFRRPGMRSPAPRRGRCGTAGCSSSRSSMRSARKQISTGGWSCTAATVTLAVTSSGCWPPSDCSPEIVPAELRMESGAPVAGLVVRGTKAAAPRL